MRDLNATACAALYDGVEWSSLWNVVTLIVLAIVDVMVVVGNVLVILAVYCTSKLRNVTNMFIVSLAVADLMVGVAVLPFSATWEVYKVRSFSDVLIGSGITNRYQCEKKELTLNTHTSKNPYLPTLGYS